MPAPSNSGKRPPVTPAAAAAAGVPFDVAIFMSKVVPVAAKAAMTPPLSTAVAPSEEANLHSKLRCAAWYQPWRDRSP